MTTPDSEHHCIAKAAKNEYATCRCGTVYLILQSWLVAGASVFAMLAETTLREFSSGVTDGAS